MPFASTPQSRNQRNQAYLLLGVEPNAVADAPKIAHLIAKITGGKPAALEALRASDLPEARHFISKYDNIYLPSFVRRILPIEAFAIAAGISPTRLFGVIAEVIRQQKAQLGAIKAAEHHERIVAVSSTVALDPMGVEDRMAHLKHMGFTPSPKGSTINIGIAANATATAASASAASAALPTAEDTIRRIIERRQQTAATLAASATKELPAASAMPIPQAFQRREPVMVEQEYVDGGDEGDD